MSEQQEPSWGAGPATVPTAAGPSDGHAPTGDGAPANGAAPVDRWVPPPPAVPPPPPGPPWADDRAPGPVAEPVKADDPEDLPEWSHTTLADDDGRWARPVHHATFAPPVDGPLPAAAPLRQRRRWPWISVIVLLLGGAGGLGWLSYHNYSTFHQWKSRYLTQAAETQRLTAQLQTANQRIQTLNGQVATLNGQVGTLQNELAAVADQKEKAVDQATVLQRLLTAAGQVADDLQQCITATNQFDTDLNTAVNSNDFSQFPALQSEAAQVDTTCNRAESANQALQSAIKSSS